MGNIWRGGVVGSISYCVPTEAEVSEIVDTNGDGTLNEFDDWTFGFNADALSCSWTDVPPDSTQVRVPVTIRSISIDFNGSGARDYKDLFMLADHMGATIEETEYDAIFDLNGDGVIDFDDFFKFSDHWY